MGKTRAIVSEDVSAQVRLFFAITALSIAVLWSLPARAATSEEVAAAIASLNAGTAAIQSGRSLEAVDYLNAAIEGNALDAERMALAYHHRGIAHQKLGLGGHAVADYTSAIWQGGLPTDVLPRSYYNRAVAYAGMGQQERAERDYDKAIELSPDYASAFHNRGNLRRHLGRHEDAIADYDRALILGMQPRAHLTYFARALSHNELGKQSAALDDAARSLELKADFAPAQTALMEWDDGRLTRVATRTAVPDSITTASLSNPNSVATPIVEQPVRSAQTVSQATPARQESGQQPMPGLDAVRLPPVALNAPQKITLTPPDVAAIEPQDGSVTVRPLSQALPPPRASDANNGWQATVTRFAQPSKVSPPAARRTAAVPVADRSLTTASINPRRVTPTTPERDLLASPRRQRTSSAPVIVAQGNPSTATDASPAPRGLRVQIGSFRSASDATSAWDKTVGSHRELIGQRQPYIVEADLGERGTYYRLQVGPLHSRNEAKALCNALKARGQDCIIAAR